MDDPEPQNTSILYNSANHDPKTDKEHIKTPNSNHIKPLVRERERRLNLMKQTEDNQKKVLEIAIISLKNHIQTIQQTNTLEKPYLKHEIRKHEL